MGTFRLKRDYTLQDFFDNNKTAKCIVFYVAPEHGGTVFHPGNTLRCAVVKDGGQQSSETKPGTELY